MSCRLYLCAIGVAVGFGVGSAHATNIVVNGGFEIMPVVGVTPFGYSQSGDPAYTGIAIGVGHSGQAAYDFGGYQADGFGFLSQALATTAGQSYELNYYLLIPGGGPSEFLVNVGGDASTGTLVGGDTLMDLVNPPSSEVNPLNYPANFALESATFKATSSSTNLIFGAYNNSSFFVLDDISVSAVPLPPTAPLLAAGLLALGALGYARRSKTQASE